jgi:hypothetical protein
MIRYSLQRILLYAGRSSKRIVLAFKAASTTRVPKNRFDPLYAFCHTDFSGQSFMHNPQELLYNSFRWTHKEVAQYIILASYRNFADYLVTGEKSLSLLHVSVSEATIKQNRLLYVDKGRIYFYYEEVTQRRNKIWH